MLDIRDVTRSFYGVHALNGVTLHVPGRGITGLIFCFMTRGREPRTPIASAAIGVVGAIIADYAIHRTDCCAQMSPADLIGILIGALILLGIDRYARSKPQ